MMVSHQAESAGVPLQKLGSIVYFREPEDDQPVDDDVVYRRWKVGFRSWVVGVSATISRSRQAHPVVATVEAQLPSILATLQELPKPTLWQRIAELVS